LSFDVIGQGLIFQLHQNDSPPSNTFLPLFNLPSNYTSPDVLKSIHFGWTDETWESSETPIESDFQDDPDKTDKQKYRAMKKKWAQDAILNLVKEYKAGDFDA
jgi:hypothetical protein